MQCARHRRNGVILLPCLLLLLLLPAPSLAKEPRWSAGLTFDFASGDYGTGITTDSYTTSLVLNWYPTARLDLEATVPYLYQSSSTTTLAGRIPIGSRQRRSSGEATVAALAGPGSGGMRDPGETTTITDTEASRPRQGLGDVLLGAGYILVPQTEATPRVRAFGTVKLPTADEKEGLGTGEFDAGAGLDLSHWLGDWHLFVRGTAIFQGGEDELGLRDYRTGEAGAGRLLAEGLLLTVSGWGATSPSETSSSQGEVRLKLHYWNASGPNLSAYLARGLTGSSHDFAAGAGIFFPY